MIRDLDELFAPMGAAVFFAEHYEKRPFILAAENDTRRGLLSIDELVDAVGFVGPMSEGLMCFPEHLGMTKDDFFSSRAKVVEYLEAGHAILWNRARGIFPAVDALSVLMAKEFGAHVWPNVYATGLAGRPFDMHFDAHEVITVQCSGEKEWTISDVRVDRPLEAVEMESTVQHVLRARREEAEARTLCTFTARPGDLVYIPRGQFHNARAMGGLSLHVTLGMQLPTGFDVAKRMVLDLLADPMLREYVPPAAADPDALRRTSWATEIALRLQSASLPGAIATASEEIREWWVKRSGGEK